MVRILGRDHDKIFLTSKTKPQRLYRGLLGLPSQIPLHEKVPSTVIIIVVVAVLGSITIMLSSQSFQN